MSHKGTRVLVPLQLVLLSVCIVTVGAADGTHGADSEANTQQLREAARQQPYNPLAHVQLAVALHELNHHVPDGGSRVPEAEREYRSGLSLRQGRSSAGLPICCNIQTTSTHAQTTAPMPSPLSTLDRCCLWWLTAVR